MPNIECESGGSSNCIKLAIKWCERSKTADCRRSESSLARRLGDGRKTPKDLAAAKATLISTSFSTSFQPPPAHSSAAMNTLVSCTSVSAVRCCYQLSLRHLLRLVIDFWSCEWRRLRPVHTHLGNGQPSHCIGAGGEAAGLADCVRASFQLGRDQVQIVESHDLPDHRS